jgi:putative membrane protein
VTGYHLAHSGHEEHAGHAAGSSPLVLVIALVAAGYLVLAVRQHRDARGWNGWRTASFLAGALLLALAVLPQASPYPAGDFRGHMLQHLLIGMLAPMGLALAAPVTLLLRSVPARWGRMVGRVLRSRPAHVLTHPATILLLNLGGLVALYATPAHALAAGDGLVHHLVHLHFLLSGYLFAWVIAGPDPAPRRPTVRTRLVLLGIAVTVHAVLSQLMYAGVLGVAVPVEQLRGAAELMYYGGDIAELLLAFALVSSWRTAHRTAASNTRRLASATRPDSSPSSPR